MAKKKKQMIACNRCGKMFVNDGFVKCGKCVIEVFAEYNARLTKRAVDEGDSAPLQAESTPEHLPIEEADTTPALRN